MKKILVILAILISILVMYKKDDTIIIPNDSIRFRVIASSSSLNDQITKNNLSISLESYIQNLLKEENNSTNALNKLLDNYDEINKYIKEEIKSDNYSLSIGKNYFPKKTYKGVIYNKGIYDSLVVTLGDGEGLNWWCVVYPPLCLVEDSSDVKYTTVIKEILNKY